MIKEEFKKVEANLRNRIKLLEVELEEHSNKDKKKIDRAIEKIKKKAERKSKEAKELKEKFHKVKMDLIERDRQLQESISNENELNQKYQITMQNFIKEQEKSQRLESMLIANVKNAKDMIGK